MQHQLDFPGEIRVYLDLHIFSLLLQSITRLKYTDLQLEKLEKTQGTVQYTVKYRF